MPIGRSGPHGATGVGFLAQQPQFGVYSIDQIHILRPIWKSLPDQPYPPNAFQSWTASYVLSLIGQDRLPIGEQVTDLAPSQRPLDRIWPSWTASYNLNLRGKDQLPAGDQFTELPPRPASRLTDYTWIVAGNNFPPLPPPPPSNVIFRPYWKGLPDQPPTPLLQQSVFQAYPTLYTVVAALPVPLAKQITDTPAQPSRLDQTWTWQYNKNLIGQDQLPVGEQVYLLVPSQVVPDQIQLRSWQWSFNLNLIGRDRLPIGEQVTDLAPSQRTPEQIQLHSWLWSYNLNLRGKDQVPVGEQISELAPSQKPAEQPQLRVWTWSYNLSLIAQDRLPVGEQIWERPTLPVAPALTWTQTPAYEEIAKPFLQTDWPNPTAPYRIEQTWAAAYNKNLIGQDTLPTGEQSTELAPRDFPRLLQTWISSVNVALVIAPPIETQTLFKQISDLPPRGVEPDWRRSWEWQYNKNLIAQDALPFRQSDWQNPIPPTPVKDWIVQTNLALLVTPPTLLPFKRALYDLPAPALQPASPSWTVAYNLNLVAQDQLPLGKQIFDTPVQPSRLDQTWAYQYNKNLIGADTLPFRQQDWPLTSAAPALQRSSEWLAQTNLVLNAAPIGATTYELPPAYKLAQAAQTFTNTISLALTGLKPPIAQRDWPNPTGFARDPTLGTITASYNLNLIALDALPVRQQDWPNPTAFARDPTLPFIGPPVNPANFPVPPPIGSMLIVHVPSFEINYSDGRVPQ